MITAGIWLQAGLFEMLGNVSNTNYNNNDSTTSTPPNVTAWLCDVLLHICVTSCLMAVLNVSAPKATGCAQLAAHVAMRCRNFPPPLPHTDIIAYYANVQHIAMYNMYHDESRHTVTLHNVCVGSGRAHFTGAIVCGHQLAGRPHEWDT